MKPYVAKLSDYWAWGCWQCNRRSHPGFKWRQAVTLALWHAWRHEVGLT